MSVSLSCPSCNTAFTLAALPANLRTECPRCGDVFPVRGFADEPAADTTRPEPRPRTINERLAQRPSASGSTPRMFVVGIALAIVALVIVVASTGRLWTKKPPPEAVPAIAADVTRATELAGLGYLPADTNIAFAAQPGPFLAYAGRAKQDAGELLTRAGLPGKVLGTVADLGLTLPQIDHIVGGTSIGNGKTFEPRLALVLVLRQPVADEDDFLRKLKAKKQPGGHSRFDVTLGGLPLTLARVSPTVWVFGFDAKKDLEAVERGGYGAGGTQFPVGLAEMLTARIPPDAVAWLATNDEHWSDKDSVKFVIEKLLKKPEWLPALARGRAVMAAVSFGDPPRVRLFVKAADEATGKQLRGFFQEKGGADAKIDGTGEFAQYDAPIDPANVASTVQQFLGEVKK